jgi:hypothetical protein
VEGAQVSGFILATGNRGRIVIGGSGNSITGILIAEEIWPAGVMIGSLIAQRIRCGIGAPSQDVCKDDLLLDRISLPETFLQPWDLGSSQPEGVAFQTLNWNVR